MHSPSDFSTHPRKISLRLLSHCCSQPRFSTMEHSWTMGLSLGNLITKEERSEHIVFYFSSFRPQNFSSSTTLHMSVLKRKQIHPNSMYGYCRLLHGIITLVNSFTMTLFILVPFFKRNSGPLFELIWTGIFLPTVLWDWANKEKNYQISYQRSNKIPAIWLFT